MVDASPWQIDQLLNYCNLLSIGTLYAKRTSYIHFLGTILKRKSIGDHSVLFSVSSTVDDNETITKKIRVDYESFYAFIWISVVRHLKI